MAIFFTRNRVIAKCVKFCEQGIYTQVLWVYSGCSLVILRGQTKMKIRCSLTVITDNFYRSLVPSQRIRVGLMTLEMGDTSPQPMDTTEIEVVVVTVAQVLGEWRYITLHIEMFE